MTAKVRLGRPPKAPGLKRGSLKLLKLTESERKAIRAAAAESGKSESQYIRDKALA